MRLLTAVELLLILLESRNQPMHVGGLFLFELPKEADEGFVNRLVKQMCQSQVPPSFPFNQMLNHTSFWQTDDDFKIEHHFRHLALPKPARMDELLVYVSQEHGKLLNRAKPLWECHVIEGIEPIEQGKPERFALYFKIHHAMVDGMAAMQLVQKLLSKSPNEKNTLPLWALMTRHQIETISPVHKSAKQIIQEQLATIKPVFQQLKHSFANRHHADVVHTKDAPACILNQRISSSRRIFAQSYELQRFQALANKLKVSMNDVVLAVCAGALRQYLLSLNALPDKPLIAFVPISLRKQNDHRSNNQVSFVLANLATDQADPMCRLKTIHQSMQKSKQKFSTMSQAEVINYSAMVYAGAGLNILTGLYPKKQAFNLIISNVPASSEALYWHGAKLQALYPASVVFDGQALNITLASYMDKLEFGMVACREILPNIQKIFPLLEKELNILEKICQSIFIE